MLKRRSFALACALSISFIFQGAALADETQPPGGESAQAPPAFTRALRQGSRGDDVAALQGRLTGLGFFKGEADGEFGEDMKSAVMLFQLRHGLEADGVVDRKTYEAAFDPAAGDIHAPPVYKFGKMNSQITLKKGSRGDNVKDLQTALMVKGFYAGPVNGSFDAKTKSAVMGFQSSMGLKADGLAGNYTLSAAYTMLYPPDLTEIFPWPAGADAYFGMPVEKLDWSAANREAFKRGMDAAIVDVRTGYVFNVRRTGGSKHADVETLTPMDTARFYMAAGNFSWARRPVWVIVGGRRLAASMNCMPHGYDTMDGNDFRGQFCIHFIGSRTHGTNKVDPEHQACIEEAYQTGLSMDGPPGQRAAPAKVPEYYRWIYPAP